MAAHHLSKRNGKSDRRRGNVALEFALVSLLSISLLFGTISLGITLGRALQAVQITRDAGHMYGLGVDFSTNANKTLLQTLASSVTLSPTGNAVMIFSQVMKVFAANCTAAAVTPCTNANKQVVVQRIVVGNSTLRPSALATPTPAYMNAQGNISAANYMKQPSVVVTGFPAAITQADGDVAYVVEGYFSTPDLSFLTPGFAGATGGIYARSIF